MNPLKPKITMMIEKTASGFSANASDFPIFTTAGSVPELLNNVLEAVQLYFEDSENRPGRNDLRFEIDFAQFFRHYKVINARFLAERIGLNPTLLSQYVRGHKKPGPEQLDKILSGIHKIGQELSDIHLIHRTGK